MISDTLADKLQEAHRLHQSGQAAHAMAAYEEIHTAQPWHVEALIRLGVISAQTGDKTRAVALFGRAVQAEPSNALPYNNRGLALQQVGQLEEALGNYDRAIALKADYADAHFNRGNVLLELRRWQDSLDSYDRAIASRPRHAAAHANRGVVLKDLQRLSEAIDSFDRAIAIGPDFTTAVVNRATTLLLAGQFGRGWPEYQRRPIAHTITTAEGAWNVADRLWLGDKPIAGKTILLRNEQGLGDTIQFCRYAKLLSEKGASVLLQVQRPLMPVLTGLEGAARVFAEGDVPPPFDYQCPLMSLPFAFNTTLDSIPNSRAYLRGNPENLRKWRAKLGTRTGLRVGLAWSGSRTNPNDRNRSIALSDLVKYLPDGIEYISLLKDVRESDREVLKANPQIVDLAQEQAEFSDAASLCECVDVVVSVDTSLAHLSAALGRRTWILLSHCPGWRWMLDREDSPWYPTVELLRAPEIGEWHGALTQMAAALVDLRSRGGAHE
jgi:tetratricopeptide (TPR) repeat protein